MKKIKASRYFLGILLLVFSFGLILASSAQQSAEEMYEAAIFKKDADGDVAGAIKIFREIVERFPGNVEIAAKAQLQIGICYEKLGQKNVKQAQEAFQKVLDNFPTQSEEVKIAREKLSLIMQAKSISKEADGGLKIQRMELDRNVDEYAAISPDGRYVSYVDWSTGDLAVYDIQEKKKRRLTDKGNWKESFEMALNSRWSPDGKKIAYSWIGKDSRDLRIIGLDDPNPRTLFRSPYADEKNHKKTDCRDWSPDGKHILALVKSDRRNQIVSISVENGSIQTIETLDKAEPINLRYSPDGRHIAYDYPVREGYPERDIFLLTTDGKKAIKLVDHPADDFFLGFLPDGKHFLFASDRGGSRDVWMATASEGGNVGQPELVKSNIGNIAPLGITQKGIFSYVHLRSFFDVYSVEVDLEKGQLLTSPKKMIKYQEGMNTWPDYSPDGKYLAYLSRRNIREARRTPRASGSYICLYSLESGEKKDIPTPLNPYGFPRWSPDGSSILVLGAYDDETIGLYAIDVQTGEARQVVIDETVISSYGWSVDGKSIYYVLNDNKEKSCEILVRDIESGQDRSLYREDRALAFSIAPSPDGKWLAFLDNAGQEQRRLRILSVSGGEPRELCTFDQLTGHVLSPFWSPDGKYVIYANNRKPGETKSIEDKRENSLWPWSLYYVSSEGGEPRSIDLGVHLVLRPRIHPDGKHVTFGSFGKVEDFAKSMMRATGIWMMENILPKK